MSSFNYQNSALPSPTITKFEVVSLKAGTTAIANVASGAIAPNIYSPIRSADDANTLSVFLPIGLYSVQMICAVSPSADATVVPVCQQLLVDATDGTVLASGTNIGTTTATNTTYGDTIILTDAVFVNITVGRYVSLKLLVSFITNNGIILYGAFGPAGTQTIITPRITAYRMV